MTMPATLDRLFETRQNNFNLLRLLAACAVIYGHSYALNPAGGQDVVLRYLHDRYIGAVAVDVFFIISGFLITASMVRNRDIGRYLWARFLRIYPGLILCTLLMTFGIGILLTTRSIWTYLRAQEVRQYLFWNATAIETRFFLPGVFEDLKDHAVNGPLWSLALEVRCYLLIAGLYFVGLLRREVFNILFVIAFVGGFFAPKSIPYFSIDDRWLHCAAFFLIGAFCFLNRQSIAIHIPLFMLLLAFAAALHGTEKFYIGYFVALSYGVWVFAFLPGLASFNRLGDYSYGVYLYGWPVQQLCMRASPHMTPIANTLCATAIAIGIGALSWHFFEKPILSLKKKRPFDQRSAN